MNNSIPQLLRSLKRHEPASGLEGMVIARIRAQMRARIRVCTALYSMSTAIGMGLIADLGIHLIHAVSRSGFASYASLVFSGDKALLNMWKELGMSLLESLPILGVIGTLATLAFVIWAASNAVSNMKKFSYYETT